MSVDGIDGCWIGPGDLGRYMRLDLDTREGREVHTTTIRSIIAACRRAGKIPGISTPVAGTRTALDRRGMPIRHRRGRLGLGRGRGARDSAGAWALGLSKGDNHT